jgi:hypothetical protein
MKPVETPPTDTDTMLPGAQFADAYAMTVTGQALDAITAANRAFGRAPAWISGLLRIRNAVVAPFRLKVGQPDVSNPSTTVGIFPLLQRSDQQIVLGLDDRHLDFRLRVDVAELGQGVQTVTATTVVRTHNLFGRVYLRAVLPFHRVIVKTMMAQALRN